MQCTSYIPVYNSRDLNVGSSGISCHLFNGNADYGEENGYNIPLWPFNMEHGSSHEKDVLRQIIQNHDTTFRHQVQELHRLYQKQRELMDEMRAKNVFLQRLPSDVSHATSCVTGWHLGDSLQSMQARLTPDRKFQHPSKHVPSIYSHEYTETEQSGVFIRKCSYNDVEFLLPASKSSGNGNEILDLTAGICHDDKRILFSERNVPQSCKLPEDVQEIRSATHNGKNNFLFDLNRPIEAAPQSVLPESSGFHDSNSNSDDRHSSMVIDLNFVPFSCFPETEMNLEHVSTVKKETLEEHLLAEILENPDIDLNTEVVPNEPSNPMAQIKSTCDERLQGPVSPENEETGPPRGKCVSEDRAQLKGIPVSSERENGEQVMEYDNTAAETLVVISSCGAHSCLSWFAEVVSATEDNLESEITKLENDESCVNRGRFFSVSENAGEEKESRNGHAGRKRRHKDSHSKVSLPESNKVREIRGFLETTSSTRRADRKAFEKSRRCPVNKGKRSRSSMLKQPAMHSEWGVLRSWGKIKKREGGLRRRASKFVIVS